MIAAECIGDAYMETEAANLMRFKACQLFDAGQACGAEANMAKYLAAKASWEAANAQLASANQHMGRPERRSGASMPFADLATASLLAKQTNIWHTETVLNTH